MQKLWSWIVDKKSHSIRKWRSSVLGGATRSQPTNGSLKPIGGSDDELERVQRRSGVPKEGSPSSQIVQDDESTASGELLAGLEVPECRINFEEFFDESADAIQIALERKASGSIHSLPTNRSPRKGSFQKLSVPQNESFENRSVEKRLHRRSESARVQDHPARRLQTRAPSGSFESGNRGDKANDELHVEFNESTLPTVPKVASRSSMSKKRYSLPQVSVSFADDPSTSKIIFHDRILEEEEEENKEDEVEKQDDASSAELNERRRSFELPKATDRLKSPHLSPHRDDLNEEDRRRFEQLAMRRQSNIQFVQSVSGRRTSTTLLPLTPAQIHLVRSLWRQVYVTKGPTVIGSTLFHRIFFKSIKTKEQFRKCPVPAQFPNHDSFSKAHCKAAAELIGQIVENLDNLESVTDELLRIGTVHAQISNGQLSGKLWNLVAETFIDCTLEWGDKRCRSETVRKAWALIIAFTFEKVKEGHAVERRHQSQLRLSSLGLLSTLVKDQTQ
ncbi:hypothetical protein Tcan_04524 [Toxocara canis]|uniref:Globin domain-containing protein n=1 Tax=Toxocara canis TaxID=6265 RepID=A0A0B2VCL4_TOXCA|nr:hypothetical protein Tcan_04524 [Toxocara canis]